MSEFANSIKTLRKQKHMTQDELAAQLCVTRQTISNYENGKSEPDIEMLLRISEVFDTDVNVLLNKVPASFAPPSANIGRQLLPPALLLITLWLGKTLAGYIVAYLTLKHPYGGWMSFNIVYSHTTPILYLLLGYYVAVCLTLLFPQHFVNFQHKWLHRIITAFVLYYLLIFGHQLLCAIRTDILYYQYTLVPDGESFISPIPMIPFLSRSLIWFWTRYSVYEVLTIPLTIALGTALHLTETKRQG